ncbi:MAG TPA: hypothetical protein VJ826_00875, partial [Candidatus Polarisedimenticolaceae bacterium]|nr:hypothetical protein [Candidatus Polarisedimenticolaceae bacterium]
MRLGRLFGVALAFVISVTAASAQSTGGLRIRIIDNGDKSEVIGASVTLSNTNKFVATTTMLSNAKGEVLFPVLRAGSGYVIQVIMDGYAGVRQEAKVDIGAMKDVVIALAPEHVERVTVIGEKTQVDLDNNDAATKFSADFIQDLPIAGRFYQNVLALAPGVQDADGDGNPNVNGARDRDFKTSVSGISNVDPLTGQFLNLVASDSIEEITVVTAGAGAEYGRAQGGFAQIIQKQGSNDFEGVFGMIYSSSKLDGNGATNISNSQLPDFYRYQPSLQVSGPIMKDKLWYRLSQEYIRLEEPLVLGSGGNVATTGTDRFSTADQITWQISNRNKMAFQFQADPVTTTNFGVSTLVPPASSQKRESGGPTYSVQWTAPYSPSLLVDTVLAYQDTKVNILPMEAGLSNNCLPGSALEDGRCFRVATGQVSGSNAQTSRDNRQRLTLRSDATFYKGRMWGMSHQFKAGLIAENERYYRELLRTPSFALSSTLGDEGVRFLATTTMSVEPFSTQRAVGSNWGIYGEDIMRPLSNLSITVGARIEQEHVSSDGFTPFDPQQESQNYLDNIEGLNCSIGQCTVIAHNSFIAYEDAFGSMQAIEAQLANGVELRPSGDLISQLDWTHFRTPDNIDITNTNIAPRLSVAWDPWNDGKTKFTVSAGRYYDKIFLQIPVNEIAPVLVTNEWDVNALYGGTPFLEYDPTFSFTVVDRNLKTPFQDEYSFAVEREIWEESSISFRYLHRNFKDQFQDININQTPGDYGRCQIQTAVTVPFIVDSPGTGEVIDVYTGRTYQDTDPGNGDGRLDDCSGRGVAGTADGGPIGGGTSNVTLQEADGFADLYVLNPAWQDIFKIGNYNSQKYDALIFEFVRRQYKNWQMEASYTWSQAFGQGEDFDLALGDDRSTLADEQGYQSYDVRHA